MLYSSGGVAQLPKSINIEKNKTKKGNLIMKVTNEMLAPILQTISPIIIICGLVGIVITIIKKHTK